MEVVYSYDPVPATSFLPGAKRVDNLSKGALKEKAMSESLSPRSSLETSEPDDSINYVKCSPDQKFFTVGTNEGFEIVINDSTAPKSLNQSYSTKEPVLVVRATPDMETFALVLEGNRDTVALCTKSDMQTTTSISFEANIEELILTKESLVVVLAKKTYLFNKNNLKCVDQILTCYNCKGLAALPCDDKPKNKILVCPAKKFGDLAVHHYYADKMVEEFISAHTSRISAVSVNAMGTQIASASEKGTLVRIFSVDGGHCLQELRRGTRTASISELIFHPTLNLLACSSNKSSIHLFETKGSVEQCLKRKEYGFTKQNSKEQIFDNRKSRFKFLHFVSGFFKSEWSGTKVKIPGNKVWGFDLSNNTITVFLTEKDKLQQQQAYNRPRLQIEIPEKACRYAKCVEPTDV